MRLIDADALPKLLDAEYKQTMKLIREGEKHLDTLAEGFAEASHIAKYIAPTVDAVPVVRCKDCEHSYEDIGGRGRVCAHGVCVDCIVPENFFCANGTRKEENSDETDR
jgi:hypothetical protein